MLYKTRCNYLQRFAVLLRSQGQGSPSVVSPFGRVKRHWRFTLFGLTPVRSTEAVLASVGLLSSICHTWHYRDS